MLFEQIVRSCQLQLLDALGASELWGLKGHESTRFNASSQRMARSQEDRVVVWLVSVTLPEWHSWWKHRMASCHCLPAAKAPMARLKLMLLACNLKDDMSPNKCRACRHCRAFSHAESTLFMVVIEIFMESFDISAKRDKAISH